MYIPFTFYLLFLNVDKWNIIIHRHDINSCIAKIVFNRQTCIIAVDSQYNYSNNNYVAYKIRNNALDYR